MPPLESLSAESYLLSHRLTVEVGQTGQVAGHRTQPGDVDEFFPSSSSESSPRQSPSAQPPLVSVEEPALPARGADDTDIGWGAEPGELDDRTDDWYLAERPPHH
jgi:hypothetical protein